MDAQLNAKPAAERSSPEQMALAWIEAITGTQVANNFPKALYSGEVLCNLLNHIRPKTVKHVNKGGMPFRERENISNFLKGCRALGVHDHALFSPNDLYEDKSLLSVVNCIHALGGAVRRSVPEFRGPSLGVADTSNAHLDAKREIGLATQTGGSHVASDRTVLRLNDDGFEAESLVSVRNGFTGSQRRAPPMPQKITSQGDSTAPAVVSSGSSWKSKKGIEDQEEQAARWIQTITGSKVVGHFASSLRTGQVLCELLNRIKLGTVANINPAGTPFKERENISSFIKGCRALGVQEYALFCTDDLYEEKNVSSVVKCIHALGGAVQRSLPGFKGPHLGVADTSSFQRDVRRGGSREASWTSGLSTAMERTEIDVSKNIVKVPSADREKTASGMSEDASSRGNSVAENISPRGSLLENVSPRGDLVMEKGFVESKKALFSSGPAATIIPRHTKSAAGEASQQSSPQQASTNRKRWFQCFLKSPQ